MKKISLPVFIIGLILIVFLANKYVLKFAGNQGYLKEFERVLKIIKNKYGLSIARNVERIYRLETGNLTSKQFIGTYSAGMMKFSNNFPYGWHTLFKIFWSTNPKYAPKGTKSFKENIGLLGDGKGEKEFLVFRNLKSAMLTLAEFLKHYNNNAGRWFSTIQSRQIVYNNRLQRIITIFT